MNTHKTTNVLFTLKKDISTDFSEQKFKFLGVYLDKSLRWNEHEDELAKTLSKNIFVLRNLQNKVPSETLRTAFFALFQAILSYGILIWGHAPIRHRIFPLQRKALRIVAGVKYRDDVSTIFPKLQVLTLPSLYIYINVFFILKIIKKITSPTVTYIAMIRETAKIYVFKLSDFIKAKIMLNTIQYNFIINFQLK